MNSLKYINKLIYECKKSKENWIRLSEINPDKKEVFIKCAETREEELKHLQQIKNELEAWEVVEEGIEYEEDIPCDERPEYTYKFKKWKFKLTEDDYNFEEKDKKLKKALEIKDE